MYSQDNLKPKKIQARTIRSLIRKQYGSISAFCRSTGFPRPYTYAVIRGARRSEREAAVIAAVLGKTPAEVWPNLYEPAA